MVEEDIAYFLMYIYLKEKRPQTSINPRRACNLGVLEEELSLANKLTRREVTAMTMSSMPERTNPFFFDWPSATKADRIDVALYKYFEMINTTEVNKAT